MVSARVWRVWAQVLRCLGSHDSAEKLGDFTTTGRVLFVSLLATGIGVLSAFVALALLKFIGLCTNLFFFQRWDTAFASPAEHTLGVAVVFVPIVGALIIGCMARFGSERIRGHGIPEAIEAILIHGSRVEPRLAFLKPLSSAISIGSGGPFGAEGPIIMTGGAFGSLIAQFFHLTSTERKTLLVAGAAGGMSATFVSPVAAVLLAVELLLFEWKPRSVIPVALASATAAAIRRSIMGTLLGILLIKSVIWAVALGSGTSGGVLAPLLMMGGALGGLEAMVLPYEGVGFWPLISMGAILSGTMRSPFTSIIFSFELTHDVNVLLPLLVASMLAHGFTVLTLRRSILTEKVSRRGYHLSREYAIDPLEILFTREVMRTNIVALPAHLSATNILQHLHHNHDQRGQRLYPVVEDTGSLIGVVTRTTLQAFLTQRSHSETGRLADCVTTNPVVAYPDEALRVIVYRMAQTGLTRLPVVDRTASRTLVGMISLHDLLQARVHNLEAEQRRERLLLSRLAFPRRVSTARH